MIFLTVGTIFPFDRLTRTVDDWARTTGCGAEIFGQVGDLGTQGYRPTDFEWVERLSPVDFKSKVAAADVIISHAGIGTIVTALTCATPILIMARQHALREHVNDHQSQTIRKFADRGGIGIIQNGADFQLALDHILTSPPVAPIGPYAQGSLIAVLRDMIHQ